MVRSGGSSPRPRRPPGEPPPAARVSRADHAEPRAGRVVATVAEPGATSRSAADGSHRRAALSTKEPAVPIAVGLPRTGSRRPRWGGYRIGADVLTIP